MEENSNFLSNKWEEDAKLDSTDLFLIVVMCSYERQ